VIRAIKLGHQLLQRRPDERVAELAPLPPQGDVRRAATLVDGERAVAVVCDGCSAGASSEAGARLGAILFAAGNDQLSNVWR
jgi:hypothetical protein